MEKTAEEETEEFISNMLSEEDHKSLLEQSKEKLQLMKKFKESILYKDNISIDDFEMIKSFAVSKGGFITSDFRKILYKKIYCINNENKDDYAYVDKEKIQAFEKDMLQIKCFDFVKKDSNTKESPDKKIIYLDASRSKIAIMIMNSSKGRSNDTNKIEKTIKKKLENFIIDMTSLNNNVYTYYQGYHDIGLYFLLLYYTNVEAAQNVFQHFSEFVLKENLQSKRTKSNDAFEVVSCLVILRELIRMFSPNVQEFLDQVMENGFATFATSWILSLFTHCVDTTRLNYRLMDYFMVSHPLGVYVISALIIIDKILEINAKEGNVESLGSESELFRYFNNEIDMEKIDYDYYIEKCEEKMKTIDHTALKNRYKEINVKKYYPLAVNESYTKKFVMFKNINETNSLFWYAKKSWLSIKKQLGVYD